VPGCVGVGVTVDDGVSIFVRIGVGANVDLSALIV
jgi:pantoate kinase